MLQLFKIAFALLIVGYCTTALPSLVPGVTLTELTRTSNVIARVKVLDTAKKCPDCKDIPVMMVARLRVISVFKGRSQAGEVIEVKYTGEGGFGLDASYEAGLEGFVFLAKDGRSYTTVASNRGFLLIDGENIATVTITGQPDRQSIAEFTKKLGRIREH